MAPSVFQTPTPGTHPRRDALQLAFPPRAVDLPPADKLLSLNSSPSTPPNRAITSPLSACWVSTFSNCPDGLRETTPAWGSNSGLRPP
jgi:hypothetical protein